jgi:hypothetical protein
MKLMFLSLKLKSKITIQYWSPELAFLHVSLLPSKVTKNKLQTQKLLIVVYLYGGIVIFTLLIMSFSIFQILHEYVYFNNMEH